MKKLSKFVKHSIDSTRVKRRIYDDGSMTWQSKETTTAWKWLCWTSLRLEGEQAGTMHSLKRNQKKYFCLICVVFMWMSGMYTVLHRPNKIDVKSEKVDFFMENATDSVPFFQLATSSCPSRLAVAFDGGRFGNKFFEYLTSRLTAHVMGNELFITRNFVGTYDHFFVGRKTRIVDWSYLKYECGIEQSNCTELNLNYLPELKPVSNETFRCIQFKGT